MSATNAATLLQDGFTQAMANRVFDDANLTGAERRQAQQIVDGLLGTGSASTGNRRAGNTSSRANPRDRAIRNVTGKCMKVFSALSALALFVVACVAASGALTGVAIGASAVGLGAGSVLLSIGDRQVTPKRTNVEPDRLKDASERSIPLIVLQVLAAIAIVTVGALTIAGTLSATTAGFAIFPIMLGAGLLGLCMRSSSVAFEQFRTGGSSIFNDVDW